MGLHTKMSWRLFRVYVHDLNEKPHIPDEHTRYVFENAPRGSFLFTTPDVPNLAWDQDWRKDNSLDVLYSNIIMQQTQVYNTTIGDTLNTVADMFGISVFDISRLNPGLVNTT